MKTLNSPILTLALLALVLWLGYASREPEHGYDHSEFSVLDAKPTHKQARAQVLQELWEVSDDELTQAVDLFGEHGRVK